MAAVAACCCWIGPAPAQASTGASIHPTFLPDRLGASTVFTLAFSFFGGEEGVPAPLRRMVVRLPEGLGISLRGVATCPKARLQSRGPAGCPAPSLLGRGHAVLEAHAGSQAIAERTSIWIFRGPDRGGHPVLEIFGEGETPLEESTLSTGVLEPDAAPYGWKLTVSVPPIPTVVYEPDASFVSLSLTLGASAPDSRANAAAAAIVVPRRCPAGGFPFAAGFTFSDDATANASAAIACP